MRILISALILAAGMASAGEDHSGMVIHDTRAAASIGMAKAGAGFMTLMNHGTSDDTLIAVEADFPKVELHTTKEIDGQTRMVHQEDGVPVPAGGMVTLAPGGLHVMFMGLPAPFKVGQSVPAVLIFEKAGRVPVTFDVVDRSEIGDQMGHGMQGHDMPGHGMPGHDKTESGTDAGSN